MFIGVLNDMISVVFCSGEKSTCNVGIGAEVPPSRRTRSDDGCKHCSRQRTCSVGPGRYMERILSVFGAVQSNRKEWLVVGSIKDKDDGKFH